MDELIQLMKERQAIERQEQVLLQERKQKVAWLAQCYGLLNLNDDELCLAFEKIAARHHLQ